VLAASCLKVPDGFVVTVLAGIADISHAACSARWEGTAQVVPGSSWPPKLVLCAVRCGARSEERQASTLAIRAGLLPDRNVGTRAFHILHSFSHFMHACNTWDVWTVAPRPA